MSFNLPNSFEVHHLFPDRLWAASLGLRANCCLILGCIIYKSHCCLWLHRIIILCTWILTFEERVQILRCINYLRHKVAGETSACQGTSCFFLFVCSYPVHNFNIFLTYFFKVLFAGMCYFCMVLWLFFFFLKQWLSLSTTLALFCITWKESTN